MRLEQYILDLAMIDYPEPRWLFFKGISLWVIFTLLFFPFICSIFLQFTNRKHSVLFVLSDYCGLVYFQPEITGRRNISMKIYSLSIMLASLVVVSFYLVSLEQQLGDLSSSGGHSLDIDGMAGVDVWVPEYDVPTSMHYLIYPRSYGAELNFAEFQQFVYDHPAGYYSASAIWVEGMQHQDPDCRFKYVGLLFPFYYHFAFGHIDSIEKVELNMAIVDNLEYGSLTDTDSFMDYFPEEYNVCKNPGSIESFIYTFMHFYELWFIYLGALLVATVVHFGWIWLRWWKWLHNTFMIEGVRSGRIR